MKRNVFVLAQFLSTHKSSLVFLSEPQAYQCDLPAIVQYVNHDYSYSMNSDDLIDPELPLVCSKAKGGTMILWRKWLDPYVKIIPVAGSSYLPMVLILPECRPSVHIALYLPTHGQDSEFVSEMASLTNCLDSLNIDYNYPSIYIRGDANVNCKNTARVNILESFMNNFNLVRVDIAHRTYHHFVGGGQYDSNIDVILHSAGTVVPGMLAEQVTVVPGMLPEQVTAIICQKTSPEMSSHHDAILSAFSLAQGQYEKESEGLVCAPKLNTQRTKIMWTEEGVKEYSILVSGLLQTIRNTWLHPHSQACMSVLLELTTLALNTAAAATNPSRSLTIKPNLRKKKVPQDILKAKKKLNTAHRRHLSSQDQATAEIFKQCRKNYHRVVRSQAIQADLERDSQLFNIIGENPGKVFSHIKSMKSIHRGGTAKLTVGSKVYCGEKVADGFYESMTSLKQCDIESISTEPELSEKLFDHKVIMELCQNHSEGIPRIDIKKSTEILRRIKKNVKDHYSTTSLHYLYAGKEGLQHYNLLLNGIISNINNAGLVELNTAHGLIYFKGHRKDRSSDRSYRTISTCPFLAKSVDMYLRDLYSDLWQDQQADTQYQGTGSTHELASLLLTEVIQYSLYNYNQPVYLLALDAQSAFDRCLRQVLTSELYKAGMPGAAILLIDRRLASRRTVYEWEGTKMGPATDITGFEQGGVNSSDFYKLYNNEQLKTAQESKLGVDIGSGVISAIGQADDVMLASHNLYSLQMLVSLTEQYCAKFRVKLEPNKTKLLCYFNPKQAFQVEHALNTQEITINKKQVKVVKEAEHVGVLRSSTGNLPHVLNRVAMHKNALHALLPAGLARRHRGNPAASLRLGQIYGVPVLLSGLASLVLSQSELKILDSHYLNTLRNLLKLYDKTPRSIIYLLAGSLPASALLHQRQLTLFLMICHLHGDPLHAHAEYVLLHSENNSKSWFMQVRNICAQYDLPHPLILLHDPPAKHRMRKLVKLKITEHWQAVLTSEAMSMSSLQHLNPTRHSVVRPHQLWTTAGSSPHEANKAVTLARMMSGRYRTERLCRFWTTNKDGYCLLEGCNQVVGDLEHLLVHCPGLHTVRSNLEQMWLARTAFIPPLHVFVKKVLTSSAAVRMAFILDCVSVPEIVSLHQTHGMAVIQTVLYITRTYAYSIHRKKLILTGKWPYKAKDSDCSFDKISKTFVAGNTKLTKESHEYALCTVVPCEGDQFHHQPCSPL